MRPGASTRPAAHRSRQAAQRRRAAETVNCSRNARGYRRPVRGGLFQRPNALALPGRTASAKRFSGIRLVYLRARARGPPGPAPQRRPPARAAARPATRRSNDPASARSSSGARSRSTPASAHFLQPRKCSPCPSRLSPTTAARQSPQPGARPANPPSPALTTRPTCRPRHPIRARLPRATTRPPGRPADRRHNAARRLQVVQVISRSMDSAPSSPHPPATSARATIESRCPGQTGFRISSQPIIRLAVFFTMVWTRRLKYAWSLIVAFDAPVPRNA